MNNLIIAKNYETFGDAGLTSNKVIYYKEDNMVKFRANITDNPFGESEVVTVGGIGGIAGMYVFRHKTRKWYFKIGFPAILIMQIVFIIYVRKLV